MADECFNTLSLTPGEYSALLERMDAAEGASPRPLRADQRYPYRCEQGLIFQLIQKTATPRFLVKPRNLSALGILFLHGGFVYSNIPCSIRLKTLDGEYYVVKGRTVRCELVQGKIHEVGMRFDHRLQLEDFVRMPTGMAQEGDRLIDRAIILSLAATLRDAAFQECPRKAVESVANMLARILGEKAE